MRSAAVFVALLAVASCEFICPGRLKKTTLSPPTPPSTEGPTVSTSVPETGAPATGTPSGGSSGGGGSGGGSSGGGSSGGGTRRTPAPTPVPTSAPTPVPTPVPTDAPDTPKPQTPTGPWRPIDLFYLPDGLYFCDDFTKGLDSGKWSVLQHNVTGSGAFDIYDDGDVTSLRYNAGKYGDTLDDGEILLLNSDPGMELVPSADYYVQYRVRPRDNGNTALKYLYGMGRYQGPLAWYFGGLNMQAMFGTNRVEAGVAASSVITPFVKETVVDLVLGTRQDDSNDIHDGKWYILRFDMIGSNVSVYLDGELQGSFVDSTHSAMGTIGLYTYNRAFEVDYVKIGDPTYRPVRFVIDYEEDTWQQVEGKSSLEVQVTAVAANGSYDGFGAVSSNTTVASVSISGSSVYIKPEVPGTSTVTFVSGSDPDLTHTITVTVIADFSMPDLTYGDLTGYVYPAPGASGTCIDPVFRLDFDSAPVLQSTGSAFIFRSFDDTQVDAIYVSGETEFLGYSGQTNVRGLHTTLIWVDGKSVYIRSHANLMQADETYYVAIGVGLVQSGVTLKGMVFEGVGKLAGWSFTTGTTTPTSQLSVVVDHAGSGHFCRLQSALNWMMTSNAKKDTAAQITVKEGVYFEPLYLRQKHALTIVGEGVDKTVVQFENYQRINSGSGASSADGTHAGGRSVFLVESCDLLVIKDLTVYNTHTRASGSDNQAEAIFFNSQYRMSAINARFIGEQDTLQLKGYTWFYKSEIQGNVDFIWGSAVAAVFEDCDIVSLGDSQTSEVDKGGFVVQSRAAQNNPGFVFLNSRFKHQVGPAGNDIMDGVTYLARSSGVSTYYDNVAFINCAMDTHVAAIGYAVSGIRNQPNPNPMPGTAFNGWKEQGTTALATGTAIDLSIRQGAYTGGGLSTTRAAFFTSYSNGAWKPTA